MIVCLCLCLIGFANIFLSICTLRMQDKQDKEEKSRILLDRRVNGLEVRERGLNGTLPYYVPDTGSISANTGRPIGTTPKRIFTLATAVSALRLWGDGVKIESIPKGEKISVIASNPTFAVFVRNGFSYLYYMPTDFFIKYSEPGETVGFEMVKL